MSRLIRYLGSLRRAGRLLRHRALPPWGSRPRYPYERYWNTPTEAEARDLILTGHSDLDRFEAAGKADAARIEALAPDRSSVILDFGCGIGRITGYLSGYALVYGVDVNSRMLSRARQRVTGGNITFLKTDGRKIDVPEGSIDLLFSFLVLQHMDRGDVGHLTAEFRRVLKPTGRCFLQFPEYGDTEERDAHTRPWTVEEVRRLLEDWSILSLEREPGASDFVNIWVVAQPKG